MTKLALSSVDEGAMRDAYVANAILSAVDFDRVAQGCRKINALELGGINWPICYLARDLHDQIPWSRHLQAWSAGLGILYDGVENFYHRAIQLEVFPSHFLNRTLFYRPPADARKIPVGRLLQQLGLVSAIEMQRALGIQLLVKQELGLPMRIGRLLSSTARLSLPDFLQAMAMHFGYPYENIERTLPLIERAVDP
jgi:hypothetical protein